MNGWVKLHRKILSSDVASADETLGFFMRLVMLANRRRTRYRRRWIEIGCVACVQRDLGEYLYRSGAKPPSRNTLHSRISELIEVGAIEKVEHAGNFTILKVINYQHYQGILGSDSEPVPETLGSDFEPNAEPRIEPDPEPQNKKVKKLKKREKATTLARPSSESEIRAFAITLDPANSRGAMGCVSPFMDHYTANGWVQGKGKPIKDWKAAFRGWVRRQNDFSPNSDSSQDADFGPVVPLMTREQLNAKRNLQHARIAAT